MSAYAFTLCHYCAIGEDERGEQFKQCCNLHESERPTCSVCRGKGTDEMGFRLMPDDAFAGDHGPENPMVSITVTFTVNTRADEFWSEWFGADKPEGKVTADDVMALIRKSHTDKFDFIHDTEITMGDPEVQIGCGASSVNWS